MPSLFRRAENQNYQQIFTECALTTMNNPRGGPRYFWRDVQIIMIVFVTILGHSSIRTDAFYLKGPKILTLG